MSNPIFYVGQQVGCLLHGEGVVRLIRKNDKFPVECLINEHQRCYTEGGLYAPSLHPTLYPIEQYRAIIANLPAPQPEKWQPKPGEWCWFWSGNGYLVIEQFAEYLLPSKNYKTKTGSWYRNCAPFTGELPEHLKEVQP